MKSGEIFLTTKIFAAFCLSLLAQSQLAEIAFSFCLVAQQATSAGSRGEKRHLLPRKRFSSSTYPAVFISVGKSPLPKAPWLAEIAT